MAHSTHSHNNWRQKERESESGDGASPSVHLLPHSLHEGLSLFLFLSLIVSIYSQSLTSIKCSVTMTTLAALGRRVAVHSGMSRFFPLCLPGPCLSLQLLFFPEQLFFHVVLPAPSSPSDPLCPLLRLSACPVHQETVSQRRVGCPGANLELPNASKAVRRLI